MTARAFVRFPHLPRAVLALPSTPVAVVLDEREDGSFVPRAVTRIVDATDEALREGVRIGQRVIDAERFCPGLTVRVVGARRLHEELVFLAELLLSVVPGAEPWRGDGCWGLICDVAHMPVPVERLLADLEALCVGAGHPCVAVAAHSARLARAASHRLARTATGRTRLVIHDDKPILERLDLASLELPPELEETLRALGVHGAVALRALVDRGGVDRLGVHAAAVVALFHQQREPVTSVVPAPLIRESIELDDALGSLEPLTFLLRRLCERACLRTEARRERVAEMALTLARKRGAPTVVTLAFPAPLLDVGAIVRSFVARLERLTLDAAFDAVTLEVVRRVAASHKQLPLDPRARAAARVDEALLHLMAEMQAELGAGRVGALTITDEVMPEKMTAVAWPPPQPKARTAPKARRRERKTLARSALRMDAPTAQGRFLAAWPWPLRMLPQPAPFDGAVARRELLGLLEGDDARDQPYRRAYAVLHLDDGRRALGFQDDETEETWLCGWFD